MSQSTVELWIPFESLVDSITKLSSTEKRRLWELLDEQVAQAEEELWEQDPTAQAEIREARAAYQSGDYVTAADVLSKGRPGLTTPNGVTLEQVERLAVQLPPPEQLRLVVYVSEQLSGLMQTVLPSDAERARRKREMMADALLAELDAIAEGIEGEFDSVEDIQQIREERANRL